MTQNIKILFSYSTTCSHCFDFLPIYIKALRILKNNSMKIDNIKISDIINYNFHTGNFKNIEMDDIDDSNNYYKNNYGDIINSIESVPTIYILDSKNNIISEVIHLSHDPEKINDNKEKYALEFINNIKNNVIQKNGGSFQNNYEENNYEENNYQEKYLKYKIKYLKLKNAFK